MGCDEPPGDPRSGALLVQLLQPLPAEIHIKHGIAGLGGLGMATSLRRRPRSLLGGTHGLGHQGEGAAGDRSETHQIKDREQGFQGDGAEDTTLT